MSAIVVLSTDDRPPLLPHRPRQLPFLYYYSTHPLTLSDVREEREERRRRPRGSSSSFLKQRAYSVLSLLALCTLCTVLMNVTRALIPEERNQGCFPSVFGSLQQHHNTNESLPSALSHYRMGVNAKYIRDCELFVLLGRGRKVRRMRRRGKSLTSTQRQKLVSFFVTSTQHTGERGAR